VNRYIYTTIVNFTIVYKQDFSNLYCHTQLLQTIISDNCVCAICSHNCLSYYLQYLILTIVIVHNCLCISIYKEYLK